MYLQIKRIKFSAGEDFLMFLTLTPNMDLFSSIRSVVAEHNHMTDAEIAGADYVDFLLAVKKVPDDLCAKHGFRLLRDYSYSFIRARRDM